MSEAIVVTAWKGGAQKGERNWHKFRYGIRIRKRDRDYLFDRRWTYVDIIVEDKYSIKVKITDSFWRNCSELRHGFFKEYFIEKGYIPWPKGRPPKFLLVHIGRNVFKLYPLDH